MLPDFQNINLDAIPLAEIPALLAQLAALQVALAARLLTTSPASDSPPTTSKPEILLTVPEVATRLGFAIGYTYELARSGQINAVRTGKYVRIRAASLEQFLTRQSTGGVDYSLYKVHSGTHEGRRNKALPQGVGAQTDRARKATGSERDNPVPLGARRGDNPLRNGAITQAMDPASSKPKKGGLTDG
jgi:excisionase family DNA binding protein